MGSCCVPFVSFVAHPSTLADILLSVVPFLWGGLYLQAEKNLAWEAQQQQQQNQAAAAALLGTGLGTATGPCKLYVGGLHPDISVRFISSVVLIELIIDTSRRAGYSARQRSAHVC